MNYRNLQIKIELTKRCFLNCLHCSANSGPASCTEIKPKYIDTVLKDAAALERIVLTGGEPLCCSHFFQSLEKFNRAGFMPCIYSSGITECNYSPMLLKSLNGKISKFIISLYGQEATHELITGSKGSFSQTFQFIEYIREFRIPLGIHIVALRENIENIPDLINWLKDLDIHEISILRYVPQGRGMDLNIRPPSREMLAWLYSQLSNKAIRFGAPFNFIHKKRIFCKAGHRTASIDVFGNVIPCDSFKFFAYYGSHNNLEKHRLLSIIGNSDLFKFCRKNSTMNSNNECCIGQYLIKMKKPNLDVALYA